MRVRFIVIPLFACLLGASCRESEDVAQATSSERSAEELIWARAEELLDEELARLRAEAQRVASKLQQVRALREEAAGMERRVEMAMQEKERAEEELRRIKDVEAGILKFHEEVIRISEELGLNEPGDLPSLTQLWRDLERLKKEARRLKTENARLEKQMRESE
jgi:hypothetical protein